MSTEFNDYPEVVPTSNECFSERDIKHTLGRLALQPRSYVIIGGANLVLRGIRRETPDIDMLVSKRDLATLVEENGGIYTSPPPIAVQRGANNISVHINQPGMVPTTAFNYLSGNGYYRMDFSRVRQSADIVDDIPLANLREVIASKQALARPKDIDDLRLLAQELREEIEIPAPRLNMIEEY